METEIHFVEEPVAGPADRRREVWLECDGEPCDSGPWMFWELVTRSTTSRWLVHLPAHLLQETWESQFRHLRHCLDSASRPMPHRATVKWSGLSRAVRGRRNLRSAPKVCDGRCLSQGTTGGRRLALGLLM